MPTYLQRRIGLTPDQALIVPIIGMVFMMIFLPFAGALSDRIGRGPMWRFSLLGLLVGVVPLYMLMGTGLTGAIIAFIRSEEHTSELQSLMRISYAVFCLKKKTR